MSSILKALKKVENDKNIGKPDQRNIDARILQNGSSARISRIAVSLIAIILFMGGSTATYFYMKYNLTDLVPLQKMSPSSELTNQIIKSEIIAPALKSGEFKITVVPSIQPTTTTRISNESTNSSGGPQIKSLINNQEEVVPPITVAVPVVSRPEAMPAKPISDVTRPVLTVNGIAFQDGGNDNLAVINGITVSIGAVIEGVTVEDIQKDRVRFSNNGEKFEIILNKSSR